MYIHLYSLLAIKLTINNKHQRWYLIFASVSILNMYVVHDLNSLNAYTSCTVHEQDSIVPRLQLHTCYCFCAIQHITSYVHTLLKCYYQVYHKISWVTLQAHVCKCQVKFELYCINAFTNRRPDLIFKQFSKTNTNCIAVAE